MMNVWGEKKETEIKKKKLGDGKKRGLNEKKAP
jgi:hypothetical protein